MKKIKELYLKHREVIDYLFWGVMTTLVSFVTYSVFVVLLSLGLKNAEVSLLGMSFSISITIANILSWICAVLFAFVTNKLFVFKSKSFARGVFLPEFAKFISARILTGILEMVGVPLLVSFGLGMTIFGVEGAISKIVVTVLVIILNYVFSKIFRFKTKEPDSI